MADHPHLIDPSENVKALQEAATARQDDLRMAEGRRIDELRALEERYTREMSRQRMEFQRDIAKAESKRIDANAIADSRRLDNLIEGVKNGVALAAAKAELTATNLAERVDTSAKVLAQQVVDTAAVLREAAATAQRTTDARLAALEQSRFTIAGATAEQGEGRQQSNTSRSFNLAILLFVIGQTVAIISAVLFFLIKN